MNKTVLFIAAALSALPLGSHAQEEMFPTGMTWEEVIVEEGVIRDSQMITDTLLYHNFEICGDTIIGQKTYKKVMCDGKPYGPVIVESGKTKIKATTDVTIQGEFEVKVGAEFVVSPMN
jgi:hypothetical protein